jgi:two-component system sensor histidine kinase UhpB
MVTFSLIVVLLSFGWAWRNVVEVAAERNASLAYVTAVALSAHVDESESADRLCTVLYDLGQPRRTLYVVDPDGQVLCASPDARLPIGAQVDYALGELGRQDSESVASALRDPGHTVSYAPIPGTSWGVILEEARSVLLGPTYSFLIAISALMIVGLFISFWLLWVGFHRISWPLVAVTEQARRVAAGEGFDPPDVDGPAEVEALVAAFNRMVTELRQQRDTLHEYAARMLHSQEQERMRISRDLHDETAQELVGLMQRIDLCRLTAEEYPPILDALDELAELTQRTLAGVRRTSQALRPLILEDLGLVAALQAIGEDLEQQLVDGQVFCEVIGEEQRLSPEVELTAFRIVQEALTNVRKHAPEATRVYVTVQFRPDELHISVEDDGRGFRPSVRGGGLDDEHLGLMGMRERAELLNGEWSVESNQGEGTHVTLRLPILAR